ncbi:MAG TPA: 50S ribosomal protein L25 [Candidatus Paceibacterota bacterium]|nr:50S ribosomal protein L25 [Candidatus Paceibacterota bacterium]HPB60213.1 50S ribosomal protein L25 [Candidatus Paceibacterota bacterium]
MTIKLKAQKRDVFGKQLKKVREAGQVPVVVYGAKQEATPLVVDTKEFVKVLKEAGESSIVSLDMEGKGHDVLIHEVQYHPIKGQPIHVDFYVVQKDKKIEVDVPLVFEGVAPAVKELGGNLVKVMHELPIEVLPKDLPHDIKVDVSGLATFESQILVKDIKLPSGVTVLAELEEVVVSISKAGEEVVVEEAPIDLSQIEVEKKGKQEEEGSEKASAEEKSE